MCVYVFVCVCTQKVEEMLISKYPVFATKAAHQRLIDASIKRAHAKAGFEHVHTTRAEQLKRRTANLFEVVWNERTTPRTWKRTHTHTHARAQTDFKHGNNDYNSINNNNNSDNVIVKPVRSIIEEKKKSEDRSNSDNNVINNTSTNNNNNNNDNNNTNNSTTNTHTRDTNNNKNSTNKKKNNDMRDGVNNNNNNNNNSSNNIKVNDYYNNTIEKAQKKKVHKKKANHQRYHVKAVDHSNLGNVNNRTIINNIAENSEYVSSMITSMLALDHRHVFIDSVFCPLLCE